MEGLKRILGVVHVAYAVVIAVAFVLWPTGAVDDFWPIINIASCIVIVLALIFNYLRKREHNAGENAGISREYWESNLLYHGSVVLAMLFAFNWINLLANGATDIGELPIHDWVWVIVDVMIAVISGVTGTYLLRSSKGIDEPTDSIRDM